jgi:hypothetical protein
MARSAWAARVSAMAGQSLHEGQQVGEAVVHLDIVKPEPVECRELMFVLTDQPWT